MDEEQSKLHEKFVQNVNGTTISEVLMITLPSHLCTFMVVFVGSVFDSVSHTCCSKCLPKTCKIINTRKLFIFLKEVCLVIIPLILLTTVLAEMTLLVVFCIIVTNFTILIIWLVFNNKKITGFLLKIRKTFSTRLILEEKRSYVTCCRSIVNIMTAISILAVDFNIFPRRLAKTEAQGYSLMDIGVGFFILSNSVVIKIEKLARGGMKQTILGSAVLFLLGFIRYFSLKKINYQNVVLEYGVHWNFFFTLGIIKLISHILLKLFRLHSFLPAVILGLIHQFLLSSCLEDYVFGDKPRDNWVDANREGLVSIFGYTSLYLIGVSMNQFILRKSTTVKNDFKIVAKLVFISACMFLITVSLSGLFPVSRRIVSFTYITWVTASALLHVAISIAVELIMICFILPTNLISSYNHLTPIIYESINQNGLIFFLLANLLTGLVNITFNTINLNIFQSFLILVMYMAGICVISYTLYFKQIHLKFW